MNNQNSKNYSHSFQSSKPVDEVFSYLLDIRKWWAGLFGETINGSSNKVNDEFTYSAGEGLHVTKQKLIELLPNKKIVWLVTESKLAFLKTPDEWEGTKISFDISQSNGKTNITFTHEGLIPEIECYDACSGAWSQYMRNLVAVLK